MSEYRFLCPQCGRAFEEGTPRTVCPDCQVLLRSTGGFAGQPAAAAPPRLPEHLDLAGLMQQVLAREPREETLDAALRQVLEREQPQAEEVLFRPLAEMLRAQERLWGISRLEAARRVTAGQSEMHLSPEGTPEITSFYFQDAGLEQLAPEYREQVLQHLTQAARTGKLPTTRLVLPAPGQRQSRAGLVLAIVAALGLAAFYYLRRMLEAR